MSGRVLLVEDDENLRETLLAVLGDSFSVEGVPDVASALLALSSRHYDLVVTDYEMPDGTGVQVLRTIKKSYPHIATILMTGRTDSREVRAINQSGEVMVLLKPVQPADLLAWVQNGLAMARLKRRRDGSG
ncbi:MAG: response regulator [Planctomycetota bacterium]